MKNIEWFMGVVEDVMDPLLRGRVRVRAFGYHNKDTVEVPVDSLPWASVMLPVTSASITGVGSAPTGLLPGSWVIGLFRDGDACQEPIVIGSLPSSATGVGHLDGFKDPEEIYPDMAYAAEIEGGVPDPAIASYDYQNQPNEILDSRILGVDQALISSDTGHYDHSFDLPNIADPEFPKAHLFRSELGHTIEIDDTEMVSRIGITHKDFSYKEWHEEGDTISFTVKDRLDHTDGDQISRTRGDSTVYIDGLYIMDCDDIVELVACKDFQIFSEEENVVIESESKNINSRALLDITDTAGGNIIETAGGNITETAGGDVTVLAANITETAGDITITAGGTLTLLGGGGASIILSGGNVDIIGGVINLN